jgi:arylsulfatase A-like enzyme
LTTRAAILLLLLWGGAACRKEPSGTPRPNLLLVTIDTLRADHCSVYGYGLPTTPRLERLAREGVRFDAAYAPMPSTGPSHASLFSSLHPLRHGVVANGYVLGPEHAVLAETLRGTGYRTAAVIGAYPLKSRFGYGRGFESYDEAFAREDASVLSTRWEGHPLDEPYDRRATAVTRRALEWLGRRQGPEPFLLWLHYFDPHSPYDPPEPFRSRFAPGEASASELARTVAGYDGEIAFADEHLGRVVDALDAAGLGETTLVVVTGDHGEGLNSHGIREHGEEIYEEAVRVPLILRWKGRLPAGRTIGVPVETLDIAPTAVELLRAGSLSRRMRARSLTRLLAEAPSEGTRSVLLQSEHRANPRVDTFGIRQGRWKYIERRDEQRILEAQVFDLLADPGERTNLMARQPAEAGRLAGELRAWRKTGGRAPVAPPSLSPEDREALRALGYVQ